MTNQTLLVGAVSALSFFSYPLTIYAATNSFVNPDLAQIFVTATRTANTVDETIAPVTIFTKGDIQRSQATSLLDVLRTAPGVNFSSNGGMGSHSGISIRGTDTDHVLYHALYRGTHPGGYFPVGTCGNHIKIPHAG